MLAVVGLVLVFGVVVLVGNAGVVLPLCAAAAAGGVSAVSVVAICSGCCFCCPTSF